MSSNSETNVKINVIDNKQKPSLSVINMNPPPEYLTIPFSHEFQNLFQSLTPANHVQNRTIVQSKNSTTATLE